MNHYYFEKMMEVKQKELNKVSQEFWKSHPAGERKSKFNSIFKWNKKSSKTNQVCCA